jgi:hypothetical protein
MNKRALTSMIVFFSFIILPVSGIPLHFARSSSAPGQLEHFLMSLHNSSALIFLVASAFHISFNWKAIKSYIRKESAEFFRFRKEMVIALLVVVIIVGIISLHAFIVPEMK